MIIFIKLPPNCEHLSTTEKTRKCPLFKGFAVDNFNGKENMQ